MAHITLNNWSAIALDDFSILNGVDTFDSELDSILSGDPTITSRSNSQIIGSWDGWLFVMTGSGFGSGNPIINQFLMTSGSNFVKLAGSLNLNMGGTITSISFKLGADQFAFSGAYKYNFNGDFIGGTIKSLSVTESGFKLSMSGSIHLDVADNLTGTVTSFTFQDPSGHKLAVSGISMDAQVVDDLSNTDLGHTNLTDLFNALDLSGNDSIVSGGASDAFSGGEGNDTLNGGAGNDTLDGGDDNDTLYGGTGADNLSGSDGNDTYIVDLIKIAGTPTVAALQDAISEDINAGIDTVSLRGTITLATPTTLVLDGSLANIENLDASATTTTKLNLTGNDLNNILTGNAAANILIGELGDDTLNGGAGNDTMQGGAGDDYYIVNAAGDVIDEGGNTDVGDTIQAGFSIDLTKYTGIENIVLTGSAALKGVGNGDANSIIGNAGANLLDGGVGADTMNGGKGNDTYVVDDSGDIVTESIAGTVGGIDLVKSSVDFTLAPNIEKLTLTGTDNISGTGNILKNTIIGNAGDNILDGGAGVDTLKGGAGDDVYRVDLKTTGTGTKAVASLQDSITESANAGTDAIELRSSAALTKASTITLGANLENLDASNTGSTLLNLTGNKLDNVLTGNDADNILTGGAGDDILIGGGGIDSLAGGAGVDTLDGGEGVDFYDLDNINDVVNDSGIADIFYLDAVKASFSIDLEVKSYTGIEYFSLGGIQNLSLKGDGLTNHLNGNNAANIIDGRGGDDELLGGGGNDVINGGEGDDRLYGELNTSTEIIDNTSKDILVGGAGNDTLIGGKGADTLTGGLDADTFKYDLVIDSQVGATTRDVITDFNSAELDRIDLSHIDASTKLAGNQAFSFIGVDTAFSHVAGQLSFNSVNHLLSGDVNGDGIGDFGIVLTGVSSMTGTDFIL